MASCDKILTVKDSLLLKIKKPNEYQICVMDIRNHNCTIKTEMFADKTNSR